MKPSKNATTVAVVGNTGHAAVPSIPKLIEGAKALETAINSITARGKRLDHDIQIVGLSVMKHAEAHGDVTLVNRLYNGMPKGSRRRALAEWLLAFGRLGANEDRQTSKNAPFVYVKSKVTDLIGAVKEPWFTFAPEPGVADMFDVQASLHALLSRAKKARSVNDIELLARLQQLDDVTQSKLHAAADPKPMAQAA